MKYINGNESNSVQGSTTIDKLNSLGQLTSDTVILVQNDKYGTCKLSLTDLLSFLDLRYEQRIESDPNTFIEAVDTVFGTVTPGEKSGTLFEKDYMDNSIKEHNKDLANAIEELFKQKK